MSRRRPKKTFSHLYYRQPMIKFSCGDQKKKIKALLTLEIRLNTLGTRFKNDEIYRKQYLEGLCQSIPHIIKNRNIMFEIFSFQDYSTLPNKRA
jgi:hypothetical protein